MTVLVERARTRHAALLLERTFMARMGIGLQVTLLAFVLSSACESRGDVRSTGNGNKDGRGASASEPNNRYGGGIAWFHDLFEAHKISVQTGRPLLIVFGAPWCHYCRELEQTTLRDPKIVSYVQAN